MDCLLTARKVHCGNQCSIWRCQIPCKNQRLMWVVSGMNLKSVCIHLHWHLQVTCLYTSTIHAMLAVLTPTFHNYAMLLSVVLFDWHGEAAKLAPLPLFCHPLACQSSTCTAEDCTVPVRVLFWSRQIPCTCTSIAFDFGSDFWCVWS